MTIGILNMYLNRNNIKDSISLNIIAVCANIGIVLCPINFRLWVYYVCCLFFIIPAFALFFFIEAYFKFPIMNLSDKIKNNLFYSILFLLGLFCAFCFEICAIQLLF